MVNGKRCKHFLLFYLKPPSDSQSSSFANGESDYIQSAEAQFPSARKPTHQCHWEWKVLKPTSKVKVLGLAGQKVTKSNEVASSAISNANSSRDSGQLMGRELSGTCGDRRCARRTKCSEMNEEEKRAEFYGRLHDCYYWLRRQWRL